MNKNIYISAICFGLAVLIRSDAIVFIIIAILFTGRNYLKFSLISVTPFILWQIILKYWIGLDSDVFSFDLNRNLLTFSYGIRLLFSFSMYGITFWAFMIAALFGQNRKGLLLIVVWWIGITIFYGFLDPGKMGASFESVMTASYKRIIFTFVPLAWWYVGRQYEST